MMAIETLLQGAQRPLLIGHIAPDGDAIGSLLGLGWAMKEVGKCPTLACADPVPSNLCFLPGSDEIVAKSRGDEDLIVSLDSSDLLRLGNLHDDAHFRRVPVVNIDHHVTNVRFGHEVLVDAGAAATAQIVYGLLLRLGWAVNPKAATCLLAGLITDTRSFRAPNTSAEVLRTALTLVEAGAPLAEINEQLYRGLHLGVISLWGRALSGAQYRDGVLWIEVTRGLQRECGVSSADSTGLVSFIASAREARVAVIFTERPDGRIEVGMRSIPGVDISGVALTLGGGGHRQAAGCTLAGPLESARGAVLGQLALVLGAIPNPMPSELGDGNVIRLLPVSSE